MADKEQIHTGYDEFELTPELRRRAEEFRIADVHCHIYPEKIAVKATKSIASFYNLDYEQEMYSKCGDAPTLLANGGAIGCSRYVVCSVATSTSQVDSINRFIAEECGKHPEFVGLGAWYPDIEDIDALLDQIQALGLRGVKIHPDIQGVDIDDPKLLSLYSALSERGLVALIHMGDPRSDHSAPSKLAKVLERFDDLKVDAAHFGGWCRWDEAYSCLRGSQAYYDLSSSIPSLGIEKASEIAHGYGADRIMFGCDFPMWNHAAEFYRTLQLGFSDDELQGIFYGNFARLYGIDD